METNTSKVKRVRTVSETVEVDNSGDAESKLDISASVTINDGKVTNIHSGAIKERGAESDASGMNNVGTFSFPNDDCLDLHLYRRVEGMTRGEIMDAVDNFAAQIKDTEF